MELGQYAEQETREDQLPPATVAGATQQGGGDEHSSGGRGKKLAAIHCVTPAL